MKTLDEVIVALEVCTSSYCSHPKHGDCPYLDERNDCDTRQRKLDALHYLREYREKHDEILRMEEALGYCEIMANPPLTWDELRTMGGKPIWVEYDDHLEGRKRTKFKDWEVIDCILDDWIVVNGEWNYHKSELGDIWQAYRKERS